MLFKKGKKNIAILMVIAMLLTIMPMTVFAEGEEVGEPTAPEIVTYHLNDNETISVTAGTIFNLSAKATTESAVSMQWKIDDTESETVLSVNEEGFSVYEGISFDTEGTYTITATCLDGDGNVITDENGDYTVSATVTVAAEAAVTKITAFAPLAETVASQTVALGTEQENISLPATLEAIDDTGKSVTLEVTWQCENYDGNAVGEYTFTPVIPENYIVDEEATLPAITVSVEELVEREITLNEETTTTQQIIVKAGEQLTYDLSGHNLYFDIANGESLFVVENGGTLILKDSGDKTVYKAIRHIKTTEEGKSYARAIDCKPGSSLTVDDVKFCNVGYYGYDNDWKNAEVLGAIYANGATVTLNNVLFDWCYNKENGGAISALNSDVTITNTKFISCGSINGNGGGIYANDCNITIANSIFDYCESNSSSKNTKDRDGGGAIYLEGANTVAEIDSCYFNGLYTEKESGDSWIKGGANRHGGAIYAESGKMITISNNEIDSWQTLWGNGGAIYLRIPNNAIVENNTITNNLCFDAIGKGGGIAIVMDEGNHVTLQNNTISGNKVKYRGGGLSIINTGGELNFISGEISGNTAGWGGGIDYSMKDLSPLNLQNVVITDNTAPRGGGVWACPTSETETYSTLGGAIYGNTSTGEIDDWQNNRIYQAAGSDIRYEGYSDTDDEFAKRNYNAATDASSFITVSQRVLGGGVMEWYRDEPNDRFAVGDAVANPEIYTNTNESFGLHGELSGDFQKLANSAALIVIKGNEATSRGGGIASNSPIVIGEKDADITVNVQKVWADETETHPDKVLVDLYRVDVQGNKVKLDSNIELNETNKWSASFTGLPSAYMDANGNRQKYTYEFTEQGMEQYNCEAVTEEVDNGKTYNITLTNTLKPSKLVVSKTVSGEGAETDKAFTFTVTLSDKTITGPYGEMDFKDGVAQFKLKANQSKTAEKLPDEVAYTIEESDNAGYTVTVNDTNATIAEGTIKASTTIEEKFNNHKPKDGSIPTDPTDPTEPTEPWEPSDPGTDEPTIDIPDPDVPLTEPEVPEEPTIDIEDPDVPLAEVPGETVEIEEPEVPLGDAPATGDRSAAIPFAVLMLIAAAGLAITRKRFN